MTASPAGTAAAPAAFRRAVRSLGAARLRPEVTLGRLPAPTRLAPFTHALSLTVTVDDEDVASGKLVVLHDPVGVPAWDGPFRLVIFATSEVDDEMSSDPLLSDVAWSWVTESLDPGRLELTALGGTVTATTSTRFGDIAGPQRSCDLEIRASWTALTDELGPHLVAFSELLAVCGGLPPEGVISLHAVVPSNA